MDLEFTDEQQMLREMVRGVCAARVADVRAMEDDPVGYTPEFWSQLRNLDLVGLLLPEAAGGSGQTMLEGAVVYEELGKALVPSPLFVSAAMVGGVLALAGGEDELLGRLATGETVATVAWLEPENGFSPRGVQARADAEGRITGVKRHVAFAAAADVLLVVARTGDGDEDVELFLVDVSDPGVTLTQQMTVASDTQYRVDLDGAAGRRVADWSVWHRVLLDGAILQAALASGGARQALDLTVQYAKDREQFGKPLGAFQAIAHYLADAETRVDGASTLVYEAAWARSAGLPVDRLAPMAKLFAARTYRDTTAMAQQVFGGVGFTLEYDVQLYFRRAKSLQLNWWDSRYCEELVADAVLSASGSS